MTRRDIRALQSAEYSFPYHHLPHRELAGLRVGRVFRGGAEYLVYTEIAADGITADGASTVLDVGCGDGRLLGEIAARRAGLSLTGVDLDERAIQLARAFVPGATFEVRKVENLATVYDAVACVETIEHIPDADELDFVANVGSRVSEGGRLVITVPSTARPVAEKHHRHYDVASVRSLVADALPGFDVIELREIIPHRPWLDRLLKVLSNRHYSVDVGRLNEAIARLHRAPVGPEQRGLHVLAVLRRPS